MASLVFAPVTVGLFFGSERFRNDKTVLAWILVWPTVAHQLLPEALGLYFGVLPWYMAVHFYVVRNHVFVWVHAAVCAAAASLFFFLDPFIARIIILLTVVAPSLTALVVWAKTQVRTHARDILLIFSSLVCLVHGWPASRVVIDHLHVLVFLRLLVWTRRPDNERWHLYVADMSVDMLYALLRTVDDVQREQRLADIERALADPKMPVDVAPQTALVALRLEIDKRYGAQLLSPLFQMRMREFIGRAPLRGSVPSEDEEVVYTDIADVMRLE